MKVLVVVLDPFELQLGEGAGQRGAGLFGHGQRTRLPGEAAEGLEGIEHGLEPRHRLGDRADEEHRQEREGEELLLGQAEERMAGQHGADDDEDAEGRPALGERLEGSSTDPLVPGLRPIPHRLGHHGIRPARVQPKRPARPDLRVEEAAGDIGERVGLGDLAHVGRLHPPDHHRAEDDAHDEDEPHRGMNEEEEHQDPGDQQEVHQQEGSGAHPHGEGRRVAAGELAQGRQRGLLQIAEGRAEHAPEQRGPEVEGQPLGGH